MSRWWREHHSSHQLEFVGLLISTLFVEYIMKEAYPINSRVLENHNYNSKTDLVEQINSYYGNMLKIEVMDTVICKAIFLTLTDQVTEWFKTITLVL